MCQMCYEWAPTYIVYDNNHRPTSAVNISSPQASALCPATKKKLKPTGFFLLQISQQQQKILHMRSTTLLL